MCVSAMVFKMQVKQERTLLKRAAGNILEIVCGALARVTLSSLWLNSMSNRVWMLVETEARHDALQGTAQSHLSRPWTKTLPNWAE